MLKIAFRNIFRQKRRTILTVLTMLGGFVLASFSLGWTDGTYNYVINMFTSNQMGHIQIHAEGYLDRPSLYKTLNDYKVLGAKVEEIPEATAWLPRIYSAGLASVDEKTAGVKIIGINPAKEIAVTRFDKKIVDGRPLSAEANYEAVLGRGLAKLLKGKVGDSVVIVSNGADGSIANDIYEIVGLSESGDSFLDQTGFYLHLDDAQELLVLYNRVHEIAVTVSDLDQVAVVTAELRERIGGEGIDVSPWQVFAKAFYTAMMADKKRWLYFPVRYFSDSCCGSAQFRTNDRAGADARIRSAQGHGYRTGADFPAGSLRGSGTVRDQYYPGQSGRFRG